jgi:hypothetical protein
MPPKDEEPQGQAPIQPNAADAQAAQEQLLLGKFKSPDELAKAYSELEQRFGKQSGEVGELRRQQQILFGQLEGGKGQQGGQAKATAPAQPDFDAQLADIQAKVDEGEISIAEALKLSSEVSANKAAILATQQMQQYQQQQQAQQVQTQWLEQNPDYTQFVGSPEHAAIMKANPLHDDFSAYYAWKAEQAAAQAYEKGKAEVQSLAQGAEAGRKVLAGQGATIRQNNPAQVPAWKYDPESTKAKMMATLDKIRG